MALPSIPEYNASISNPQLLHPAVLKNGHPLSKGSRLMKFSGGFCVVYPYETPSKKFAVRCWHAELANMRERCRKIAKAVKMSGLPYFTGFDYYEDGIVTPQGVQPIVVMDWVDALPLKKYLSTHINNPSSLNHLADNFLRMVKELHYHHFAHGDLQHGNIMVNHDGSLMLVDYDSMYVPGLQGMKDEVKGLAGYQHPSRWCNDLLSEKADYFSELVIYTSLKALARKPTFWRSLKMEDTETLLFSGEDIKQGMSASIFSELKNDSVLAPLADKMCSFIKQTHFEHLTPLEKTIVSESERVASKWKAGNGYDPHKYKMPDVSEIATKWKMNK